MVSYKQIKTLAKGYLFALLLLVLFSGYLWGIVHTAKRFDLLNEKDFLGMRLNFIFIGILLACIFVEASKLRNRSSMGIKFKNNGSFFFKSDKFTVVDVKSLRIRKTLFSDLLSIQVQLNNGLYFRYTCPREALEKFEDARLFYKVERRLYELWPVYLLCLFLAFDFGMFLTSGKSFCLSFYQALFLQ